MGAGPIACSWGAISSIVDVGNDQGRQLRIQWDRAMWDDVAASQPILQYSIWRRVEPGMKREASRAPMPLGLETKAPNGDWDFLKLLPASAQSSYSTIAPTLCDSTITGGVCYSTFFVRGHTEIPALVFDSPPDSGYSVDNLAPFVPQGITVAHNSNGGTDLSWEESLDADFQFFRVYRGTDESFAPGPGNLVHSTTATAWRDTPAMGYHYKITALDFAGNESSAGSPQTITGVVDQGTPNYFALYQNLPNPFNPSTAIQYDVPASGGKVRLRIYDASGRLVRTLVDGMESPGAKTVRWDGRDNYGHQASSGIYFYRLSAMGFKKVRKMVLLK
jgi:hypothetical protein